jgi:hypothetical protein
MCSIVLPIVGFDNPVNLTISAIVSKGFFLKQSKIKIAEFFARLRLRIFSKSSLNVF